MKIVRCRIMVEDENGTVGWADVDPTYMDDPTMQEPLKRTLLAAFDRARKEATNVRA